MLPRKRSMFSILAALLLVKQTEQYGSGAPPLACTDQMPRHGGIPAQTSVPPYLITTSSSQVHQGSILNVTIGSPFGAPVAIGGYILQARQVQNPDTIEGTFASVSDANAAQIVDCLNANNTVTHTSKEDKPPQTFQWRAPNDLLGGVFFRATVAQGYATFWKNVESPVVEVVTRDTMITTTDTTTTKRPSQTPPVIMETKARSTTPPPDTIYQGCDDTKLCFGVPNGCTTRGDCKAVVSVLVTDVYTFELQADSSAKYVAAGLSADTKMGEDSAMECVRNEGRVTLHASWTYPKAEPYVSRKDSPQDIVRLLESSFIDGKLYCKFVRNTVSTVQGRTFDLANDKFYLMVVAGESMKDAERVGFHSLAYESSGEALALAAVSAPKAAPKVLIKVHGAMMLLGWLASASVGILLARYFRHTWVGSQLGGKDIWFAYHRVLMVCTWLLTMVGFIVILVEVGGWAPSAGNPHAITGLVTVLLCFIQPIGAYFRPHPGTKKRPIFNWLHWFIGNSAHILAIVTIFLAVYLPKAELPIWSVYILAAFVAFHVIMHIMLSFSSCASKGAEGRVSAFPLKELSAPSLRTAPPSQRDRDAPFSSFRRHALSIYVAIVALFAAAMLCLVALAPLAEPSGP